MKYHQNKGQPMFASYEKQIFLALDVKTVAVCLTIAKHQEVT